MQEIKGPVGHSRVAVVQLFGVEVFFLMCGLFGGCTSEDERLFFGAHELWIVLGKLGLVESEWKNLADRTLNHLKP